MPRPPLADPAAAVRRRGGQRPARAARCRSALVDARSASAPRAPRCCVALGCLWQYAAGVRPAAVRAGALRLDRRRRCSIDVAFLLDPLSAVMLFVVTCVGFLIHVYSVGYMAPRAGLPALLRLPEPLHGGDAAARPGQQLPGHVRRLGRRRPLLLPPDRLLLRPGVPAATPARRRSSSTASATSPSWSGMFALFADVRHARLPRASSPRSPPNPGRRRRPTPWASRFAGFVALCLFVGAMGKSAQIPLYVWLPDAMAGPTPVSALIHAATMVTAGVYMVARTQRALPARARASRCSWRSIGAATALFAATIGLAQNDIKKVLAYSTVSQLGFMFLAAGVGAFIGGDLPPRDPRLLQGAALPRLGLGDPRHGRRAGHAQDGRAQEAPAVTYWTFADRRARDRRHPAARRLLLQGRDPRTPRRPSGHWRALGGRACSPPGSPPSTCSALSTSPSTASSAARTSRSITSTSRRRDDRAARGPGRRRGRRRLRRHAARSLGGRDCASTTSCEPVIAELAGRRRGARAGHAGSSAVLVAALGRWSRSPASLLARRLYGGGRGLRARPRLGGARPRLAPPAREQVLRRRALRPR